MSGEQRHYPWAPIAGAIYNGHADRAARHMYRAAQYLAANNPAFAKGSLLKAIRAAEQAEQALKLLQPKFVEPSTFKARGE